VGVCSNWTVLGALIRSSLLGGDTPKGPTHRPLWPLSDSGAAAEERLVREWLLGAGRRVRSTHRWGWSVAVGTSLLIMTQSGNCTDDQRPLEQGRHTTGFGAKGRLTGGLRKEVG
jgi:hypothetical protein